MKVTSQEEIDSALDEIERGASRGEIAKQLGVARSTVHSWVKKREKKRVAAHDPSNALKGTVEEAVARRAAISEHAAQENGRFEAVAHCLRDCIEFIRPPKGPRLGYSERGGSHGQAARYLRKGARADIPNRENKVSRKKAERRALLDQLWPLCDSDRPRQWAELWVEAAKALHDFDRQKELQLPPVDSAIGDAIRKLFSAIQGDPSHSGLVPELTSEIRLLRKSTGFTDDQPERFFVDLSKAVGTLNARRTKERKAELAEPVTRPPIELPRLPKSGFMTSREIATKWHLEYGPLKQKLFRFKTARKMASKLVDNPRNGKRHLQFDWSYKPFRDYMRSIILEVHPSFRSR